MTVCAFDRDGNPFTLEAEGMLARCICHESDHLDGVTIMDMAEFFYEDVEHDDRTTQRGVSMNILFMGTPTSRLCLAAILKRGGTRCAAFYAGR